VSGSRDACETEFYYHNRVTRLGKDTHDTSPAVNTPR
jgi:hypothetical protein